MQCEAFERRLQWLLDRRDRPEADDDLREHASYCEACGRILHVQTRLFQSLEQDNRVQLDTDFASRVVDTWAVSVPPRRRNLGRTWGILAAIAAAVLVTSLPFWPHEREGQVAVAPPPATDSSTSEPAPQAPEADEIAPLLQQWVQQLSEPTLEEFETVDHLSGGIRSLTSTINIAIDALRRNVPVNHEPMIEAPQTEKALPAGFRLLS
jgi:hypothetical protein